MKKLFDVARGKVELAKTALYGATTAVALSPALAFAQAAGGGDFNGEDVIAKVISYTAVGVAILGAFALGRWTLKALGVIGGR